MGWYVDCDAGGWLTFCFIEYVCYLDVCCEFLLSIRAHLGVVVELGVFPFRCPAASAAAVALIPVVILVAATTTASSSRTTVVAPIVVAATATATATVVIAPILLHVLTRHYTGNTAGAERTKQAPVSEWDSRKSSTSAEVEWQTVDGELTGLLTSKFGSW